MTERSQKYLEDTTGESAPELPATQQLHALTIPSPGAGVEPARTLPNGKFVTTLTLSSRTCRWPIGDPKEMDFHYCGQRPASGGKYCDSHELRSRQATRSRTNHQPPSFVRSK